MRAKSIAAPDASQTSRTVADVRRETNADRHIADRVLENQVPADDPRDQLAHGRVRVGVRAARDGNHRRQFGVAERSKAADDGDQDERKRQCGTCSGSAKRCRVMNDVVGEGALSIEEVSNFWPAIAVPTTVKIPEPITAPMPSAVSDHGPSVFLSRCSGSSDSEISLSIDLHANA